MKTVPLNNNRKKKKNLKLALTYIPNRKKDMRNTHAAQSETPSVGEEL